MRVGFGYDSHRFTKDKKLILGGVEIPHEMGLLAHSDGDVLLHAIMDAILGAAALGDIGHLFPDNDPKYLGADSTKLAGEVCDLLNKKGYSLVNIDSTVVCEEPKLAPHIYDIRYSLARCLRIDPEAVSVKATTNEKMGFTGQKEGIAVFAVCLIKEDKNE